MNPITFKNYKAFDNAKLSISPITILLGTNSSGKTSIFNLLLALDQTFGLDKTYNSALRINGPKVSMGEDINIIRDRKYQNILTIKFDLERKDVEKVIHKKYYTLLWSLNILLNQIGKKNNITKLSTYKSIIHNLDEEEIHSNLEPDFFVSLLTNTLSTDFLLNNGDLPQDISDLKKYLNGLADSLKQCIKLKETIIKSINESKNLQFGYQLHRKPRGKKVLVKENSLIVNGEKLIVIDVEAQKISYLGTDKIEIFLEKTSPISYSGLKINPSDLESKEPNIVEKFFWEVMNGLYEIVKKDFAPGMLNHVSPLRAHPQRYYLLDESNFVTTLDANRGVDLAEILKLNKDLKEKVNKWLKQFGLAADVQELSELINKIKITQNKLKLDITDVGFGISQVLPIITQCYLSKPGSTTLIEQPEIHLHPKMQAELADMFVEAALPTTKKLKPRNFIIETHSEYLLRRLRRRIAEGKISANDVSIYFIQPRGGDNENGAVLQKIKIEENGDIPWPKDFYSVGMEDEIAFAQAKLKFQNNE